MQRKYDVLGKIALSAKVENCQHDRQHRRQDKDQALGLQVRYAIKTFSEFLKMFRIGPRKMFFCQATINRAGGRFSDEVIALKSPQRRRKYFQSSQRLQYKEEQVADKKCLQR